jgi:snRNA-activating protein complex subunit 3
MLPNLSSSPNTKFQKLLESIDLRPKLYTYDDVIVVPFDQTAGVSIRRPQTAEIPAAALKLKCVRELVKRQKTTDPKKSSRLTKYNKHRYLKPPDDNVPADLKPHQDTFLSLRMYEPFKYIDAVQSISAHPKFQQEFFVLGSQTLTELRDRIICPSNYGPFYDISECPDFERQMPPKSDGPGFFFVRNTFYNDTRNPNNMDYSFVVRNWAAKRAEIGEMHTADMQSTRFSELTFYAGYPMVYVHQGNCEHLFTVSDARLLSEQDSLVRANYPFLNSLSSSRSTFCNVCAFIEAKFMVTGSSSHMQDPTYLCGSCFKSFHYVDGRKVGEFKAFYYYGNLITL